MTRTDNPSRCTGCTVAGERGARGNPASPVKLRDQPTVMTSGQKREIKWKQHKNGEETDEGTATCP